MLIGYAKHTLDAPRIANGNLNVRFRVECRTFVSRLTFGEEPPNRVE